MNQSLSCALDLINMHLSCNVYSLALVSSNPTDDGNERARSSVRLRYLSILVEAHTHDPVLDLF